MTKEYRYDQEQRDAIDVLKGCADTDQLMDHEKELMVKVCMYEPEEFNSAHEFEGELYGTRMELAHSLVKAWYGAHGSNPLHDSVEVVRGAIVGDGREDWEDMVESWGYLTVTYDEFEMVLYDVFVKLEEELREEEEVEAGNEEE